jgi:hypothetical protein
MPMFSESLVRVENVKSFNLVIDFGKQRLQKFQITKPHDRRGPVVHVADQQVTDLRISGWEILKGCRSGGIRNKE